MNTLLVTLDNDYKIKPLRIIIMLPKTSAYVKIYDGKTKWMCFLAEDEELLNISTSKVNNSTKKELDSELIYNRKFLKTKIKYYCDEVTDFLDEEIPKVGCNYICLVVVLIDFVL